MSPTQRSLKRLREDGYTCEITEHWNQYARRRIDMLGFIDILALKPGLILGVQSTTTGHISQRLEKILALPASLEWLRAGGQIVIIGWSKKGPRGKRKAWTATERYVRIEDVMAR